MEQKTIHGTYYQNGSDYELDSYFVKHFSTYSVKDGSDMEDIHTAMALKDSSGFVINIATLHFFFRELLILNCIYMHVHHCE